MKLVGWDVCAAAVGLAKTRIPCRADALVFQIENGDVDGACAGVIGVPVTGYVDAVGVLGVHTSFVECIPDRLARKRGATLRSRIDIVKVSL